MDIITQLDLATSKKSGEVTFGWIRDYSNLNMNEVLHCAIERAVNMNSKKTGGDSQSATSIPPSHDTVLEKISIHSKEIEEVDKPDFDIWKFTDLVGRKSSLVTISVSLLNMLGLN